jgi:hypothetical protein
MAPYNTLGATDRDSNCGTRLGESHSLQLVRGRQGQVHGIIALTGRFLRAAFSAGPARGEQRPKSGPLPKLFLEFSRPSPVDGYRKLTACVSRERNHSLHSLEVGASHPAWTPSCPDRIPGRRSNWELSVSQASLALGFTADGHAKEIPLSSTIVKFARRKCIHLPPPPAG